MSSLNSGLQFQLGIKNCNQSYKFKNVIVKAQFNSRLPRQHIFYHGTLFQPHYKASAAIFDFLDSHISVRLSQIKVIFVIRPYFNFIRRYIRKNKGAQWPSWIFLKQPYLSQFKSNYANFQYKTFFQPYQKIYAKIIGSWQPSF